MHISLDGFVAGPNGELNWLKIDDELFAHVEQRISQGDRALYGRVTYELMESYWPTAAEKPNATRHDIEHAKWYSKAHKIVMSTTLRGEELTNTTIINGNLTAHIQHIKQADEGQGNDILLFGSPTATHALMREGLIDGYWLFVNPIILGEGKPLFTNEQQRASLKLVSTRQFTSGVVELNYVVDPPFGS